ncbi:MAG: M20/M25/M40 family metallo-hydrolase [Candidatus Marinimicrobia bacterium]|nr:M20/M25/M40 family metallo-hydrolase [Candidatus Neomarinimicrobiota bacterium]MDP6611856.1 M20/M25/M40 family metallo-hydrolase [Candidatus Neomarinimicrobiota bacterium]
MKSELIKYLTDLVAINSVNPDLSRDGQGERKVAKYVHNFFLGLGIPSEVHTIQDDRCNTTAFLEGNSCDKILLMNGHLDTVGIEGMNDPFILRKDGDRLYGRGTYDMLAGCAVQMGLAKYFSENPCPISLAFSFVADEENLSMGMEYLVQNFLPTLSAKPFLGIFMEPTEEAIGISHKGYTWYELKIKGLAAHGSRPEEGTSAIFPLSSALKELESINRELSQEKPHPYLGNATLHPGLIHGGTAQSVIAAEATLNWERRTLPGESQEKLDTELSRVISAVADAPGNHQVMGKQIYSRPPNEADDEPLIQKLREAAGGQGYNGMSYWADSALASQAGIPSILFGPAGHGAHAIDEWVSESSLLNCYQAMKSFILGFNS